MNEHETQAGMAATPGYRYADVVGDQLFVAGQVPLDGSGGLVGLGDPAEQVVQCLDNLQTLLGVHGFGLDDVRHVTVHVVGEHANLLAAWEAVRDWFDGNVPPSTLLAAARLGYGDQLVEIDATVLRRQ